MIFEWDENKDRMNQKKHDGISFEQLPGAWQCPRCKQPKDKFNLA